MPRSSKYLLVAAGALVFCALAFFLLVAGEGPRAEWYRDGDIVHITQGLLLVCGLTATIAASLAVYFLILEHRPAIAALRVALLGFPCLLASAALLYAALVLCAVA